MGARKNVRAVADFLGVGLSLLCLIHCLAHPVLIAVAPVLLKNLPGDDATHRTLAVVIGFVGFLAFRSGSGQSVKSLGNRRKEYSVMEHRGYRWKNGSSARDAG